MSRADPVTEALPIDERWPRAGHWLSAGPGPHAIDLAVLGVPTFARSLNKAGTHTTPAAIRRALHHYTTWCASRHVDLAELWPWDMGDVDEPDRDDGGFRAQAAVTTALAKARLLVTLGGDGSATVPTLQGLDLQRAGLVALDVQYDLRDGARNTSALRTLFDLGLDGERVSHLGAADWAVSRSHADEAKALGMTVYPRGVVEARGVAACMSAALDSAGQSGPVHVSFDLTVCDRSVVPGCLEALPGGLRAADLLSAAFIAGRDPNVRSVDIVEVDATADSADYRTVRLAALVVLEVAAGLALRPQA
ncbi:MAG TPA: arginase family protein [Acidothermaceae bacterium]